MSQPGTTNRLAGVLDQVRHFVTAGSRPKLAFWAAAFAVGAFLGYQIAYFASQGGFGALAAFGAGLLAIAILVVLAVLAASEARVPDKSGRPRARTVIVAGALLAVGVGAGWAITPVLYHPTVVLQANGTMTLSLNGIDGYAGHGDAPGFCLSEWGAEGVASAEAGVTGTIETDCVGASVSIVGSDGRPAVQIWIVPAVTCDATPMWRGPADVVERTDDDRSGQIVFTGAALMASGETGRPPEGWPAELSGTLSWSCGEWDP